MTVDNIRNGPARRTPIDTGLHDTNETAAVGHNAVNASGTVEREKREGKRGVGER